ncbi:MAG: hypothetical protein M3N13_03830, partial [Candidatus Eremiobacteraeota bacterium]|nr:hypothetical protein [Candidatus Eremiobacteraeota bacterium]
AYTTGMADAAWKIGRANFADGRRAFERDGANVLISMGGLFAAGLAAAFLAPFTLFLSLVAYVYFCIYTMASTVVGERRGFAAIAESVEMAYERVVPTTLMVAAIVVLVFGMSLVTLLLSGIPVVGALVSALSVQALIAYLTLVIVGEYLALQGSRTGSRG